MPEDLSTRPSLSMLPAWVLAAVLLVAPLGAGAETDQVRWQALMAPAEHAHMLGNLAEAEDGYQASLALAEKFDRSGEYLERSMAGLGGVYFAQGRFDAAVPLYRQALMIAEALYGPEHGRHGVVGIYRAALAEAESSRDRLEAAKRRAREVVAENKVQAVQILVPVEVRAGSEGKPQPAPTQAVVPPRGLLPDTVGIPADLPLPPSVSPLSHYRLAGAVILPPPPAEVLPETAAVAASDPAADPAAARRVLPPAMDVTEPAVPEANMSTAAAPSDNPAPAPVPPAAALPRAVLPPAVDTAEVAASDVAAEVAPVDAAARPADPEAPPLRGAVPKIIRPESVPPAEVPAVTAPLSDNPAPAETAVETAPADVRAWKSRALEVAGRQVDAAAVRALASDPAAPPEVAVRASAVETPEERAERLALQERHPVLGLKLPPTHRNTGPLFPNAPRLADTEQAYVAELESLERSLGPRHPDVAAMIYRLARLYQRQSRYELAGKMYERCLAIREKTLPDGHPDIVETLENYAYLLRSSGFADMAASLRERAVQQRAMTRAVPAR